MCHVWTAPVWQELSSRFCSIGRCSHVFGLLMRFTRPLAIMPSADQVPDQTLAFKNALAHVGCPDRQIDRLCITRCSPSQPSHHAGCPARSRLSRKRDGFPVSLAPGHYGPDGFAHEAGHSRDLEPDGPFWVLVVGPLVEHDPAVTPEV